MRPPGRTFRTTALVVVVTIGVLAALTGCSTTGDESDQDGTEAERSTPLPSDSEQPLSPQEEQGRTLFVENCGACHTLDAAGTQGSIGPNLDEAQVDQAEVLSAIEKGGKGSGNMPSNLLEGEDAQAVAIFVAGSGPG